MAVKILSVDDEVDLELLLTQHFRRKIRHGEYEFLFAHNGVEALEVMVKNPDISIILSDINMPEMDGLTLLSKVNEMRNPALKCIMVSAYGDMDNIRQAMNGGAFDFATKPIDLDDLDRTIEKAIEQLEFVKASLAEHAKLTDIQGDLDAAREIQQTILPQDFEIGIRDKGKVDVCASMNAAKDVGGDLYDIFPIDETHFGFTIADVSGKGVPAAIFMAISRTLIKANGSQKMSSARCMTLVNDLLCEESLNSMFVTTFYGIYNTETGHIDYTNAGHNPPYIMHKDGTVEELKSPANIVLGVFPGIEFKNTKMGLEPGDALYMYTDGVTEAENVNKDQYGEERLEQLLASLNGKTAKEIIDAVNDSVHQFATGAEQSDDITQLVIRRLA